MTRRLTLWPAPSVSRCRSSPDPRMRQTRNRYRRAPSTIAHEPLAITVDGFGIQLCCHAPSSSRDLNPEWPTRYCAAPEPLRWTHRPEARATPHCSTLLEKPQCSSKPGNATIRGHVDPTHCVPFSQMSALRVCTENVRFILPEDKRDRKWPALSLIHAGSAFPGKDRYNPYLSYMPMRDTSNHFHCGAERWNVLADVERLDRRFQPSSTWCRTPGGFQTAWIDRIRRENRGLRSTPALSTYAETRQGRGARTLAATPTLIGSYVVIGVSEPLPGRDLNGC